jgi:hypothetical protein
MSEQQKPYPELLRRMAEFFGKEFDPLSATALRGAAAEIERLTRELARYDEADRQKTREINLLTPENKRLRAALEHAETVIKTHNDECQNLCGRGEQEAVSCQYRPYFLNNGRRCPECPTYNMIDYTPFARRGAGEPTER